MPKITTAIITTMANNGRPNTEESSLASVRIEGEGLFWLAGDNCPATGTDGMSDGVGVALSVGALNGLLGRLIIVGSNGITEGVIGVGISVVFGEASAGIIGGLGKTVGVGLVGNVGKTGKIGLIGVRCNTVNWEAAVTSAGLPPGTSGTYTAAITLCTPAVSSDGTSKVVENVPVLPTTTAPGSVRTTSSHLKLEASTI